MTMTKSTRPAMKLPRQLEVLSLVLLLNVLYTSARPLMDDNQTTAGIPVPRRSLIQHAGIGTGNSLYGIQIYKAVYRENLLYLQHQALPAGWKLNVVQKWDAYGHNITALAGVAAQLAMPVSVLTNKQAAAAVASSRAAGVQRPLIRRIMPDDGPAKFADIVAAIQQGLGIEELLSPLNQQDILAAAAATKTVIPVHIYMFDHYGNEVGYDFNTTQLQDLVVSLDPKLVTIRGIMTHTGGDTAAEAAERVDQFNEVVCPVAKAVSAKQHVLLHFASTNDIKRLMPRGGTRIQEPAGLCQGPNITWAARLGSLTFGTDASENQLLSGGTSPVMTWKGRISTIKTANITGGHTRGDIQKVAVVNLGDKGRFPDPSWWFNVRAFNSANIISSSNHGASNPTTLTSYLPGLTVLIKGQMFRLVSISQNGSSVLVDVTDVNNDTVKVGDVVCIACNERPLHALAQELGVDDIDMALCLQGEEPVMNTDEDDPQCRV